MLACPQRRVFVIRRSNDFGDQVPIGVELAGPIFDFLALLNSEPGEELNSVHRTEIGDGSDLLRLGRVVGGRNASRAFDSCAQEFLGDIRALGLALFVNGAASNNEVLKNLVVVVRAALHREFAIEHDCIRCIRVLEQAGVRRVLIGHVRIAGPDRHPQQTERSVRNDSAEFPLRAGFV